MTPPAADPNQQPDSGDDDVNTGHGANTCDEANTCEQADCDYCGRPVPEHTWFGLEVQRPVLTAPGQQHPFLDYLGAIFCDQDHAARWLQTPLPPPEPMTVHSTPRANRLLFPGLFLLAVLLLALATIGAATLIRAL